MDIFLCSFANSDYDFPFLVTIQGANCWDTTTATTDSYIRFFYSPFGEYYYLDWLSTQNFIERQKFKSKLVN